MPYRTTTTMRTRKLIGGMSALSLTAGMLALAALPAQAADPLVAASITPVDRPGSIISAAPFDVGDYGYTESEYFISGEAHAYLDDGQVFGARRETTYAATKGPIAGDYTTRVIVRKPAADKFNGTLILEWTNVTTGQDGEFVFGEAFDSLLSQGYAYATVSVQSVGAAGPNPTSGIANLVATQPERYGDLEVEPDCDPDLTCPPGTLSWDIFGQTGMALKDSPDSPLADLGVEQVIAAGQSQSASLLGTYYSKIQPIDQFFDGFVLWDGSGIVSPDGTTPVISVKAEFGATPSTYHPPLGEYQRVWSVAGASHGSAYVHDYMDAVYTRDGTQPGGRSFSEWLQFYGQCGNTSFGTKVHSGYVIAGAMAAVDRWARTGEPAAPSVFFDTDANGQYLYDERGLIRGGIQTADATVPIYTRGPNTGASFFCRLPGYHGDYTLQQLEQAYVSHDVYVAQVTSVTQGNLAAGYIVQSDATKIVAAAQATDTAETDITLAGAADVSGAYVRQTVRLSVTPALVRGAWLESDGAKVPITISGTATFKRASTGRTTVIWEKDLQITDLSQLDAGSLTLPRQAGTVSVVWCIDAAKQASQFPGHVNETCGRTDLPAVTINVVRDERADAAILAFAKPLIARSITPISVEVRVLPRGVAAEGQITLTVGDQSFAGALSGNRVTVPIGTLPRGTYRIAVSYPGSDTVKPATGTALVVVLR